MKTETSIISYFNCFMAPLYTNKFKTGKRKIILNHLKLEESLGKSSRGSSIYNKNKSCIEISNHKIYSFKKKTHLIRMEGLTVLKLLTMD